MKSNTCSPIDADTNLIRSFYFLAVDQQSQQNTGIVADDACYELMFVKEQDVTLVSSGSNYRAIAPQVYTVNELQPPFHFEFEKTFTTFCIKLQPWANAMFIPNGMTKGVIDLRPLFGPNIIELGDQLFEESDFGKMVELSEIFLEQLSLTPSKNQDLIQLVCEMIYDFKGSISVNILAKEFGISRQRLSRIFAHCVKYPLKQFITQIRIRSAIEYKIKHPDTSFTSTAHIFGYYDQAHFVKDFKKTVGVTPSAFVNQMGYSCNNLRN